MSEDRKEVQGSISIDRLNEYSNEIASSKKLEFAQNMLSSKPIKEVAQSQKARVQVDNIFSNVIEKQNAITHQRSSGRCWLFAATNVLRMRFIEAYKLPESFEFSQSQLIFWDKFEKANYFLENVLSTFSKPVDGRLLSYLVQGPLNDGGQYDMFRNIVVKYGLMPQSVYPETHSSGNTRELNWLLTYKLRGFMYTLRHMSQEGEDMNVIRKKKEDMLKEIYKIMVVTLGEPPKTFDWKYLSGKDKEYTIVKGLTPLSFLKDYVKVDLSEYVSLIHDPRNEFGKCYSVEYLGNVVGGAPVLYANCEVETLKNLVKEHIVERKDPVWFGCDVGKYLERSLGAMNMDLFDFENVYDMEPFKLSKADRLRYGESMMTHAMVFTGVDIEDGEIVKFKVENSWGDKSGNKGFYSMTSKWFDEYNYQIVLPKSLLPQEIQSIFEQKPTMLPAWDPMGALAC